MKIVSTAKIKECKIQPQCGDIRFDGFDLSAAQYKEIADLVKARSTVELTIEPWQKDLFGEAGETRITKESSFNEESAIIKLIAEVATKMRERMLEKFSEGLKGWDDENCLESFKERAATKVAEGDWLDALNYIAMIRNLEKPLAGRDDEEDAEEGEQAGLLDGQETKATEKAEPVTA